MAEENLNLDVDSKRLDEFVRVTTREVEVCGSVGAATSLEMIGYIRMLENQLKKAGIQPTTEDVCI